MSGLDLAGQMLIAMPRMGDARFARTVIYVCLHSDKGAMGLVINKPFPDLTFPQLLTQLNIPVGEAARAVPVLVGGPVETSRGIVLHTDDYAHEGTTILPGGMAMTATTDILKAIAEGEGPRQSLLALGYSGWSPGQLENEMAQNAWLSIDCDRRIVFGDDLGGVWERALAKLGATPSNFAGEAGRA